MSRKNKTILTTEEKANLALACGNLFSKIAEENRYDLNDFFNQILNTDRGSKLMSFKSNFFLQGYKEENISGYIKKNLSIAASHRGYRVSAYTAGIFYMMCILNFKLSARELWKLVPFNVLDALYEDVISQYGVGLSMKEIDEWRSGKWGKLEVDFYSKDGWDASLLKKSSVFTD